MDGTSGSESRVVPTATNKHQEAGPAFVAGSAARPEGPIGSGTSAPRNFSFPISEVPFCGSGRRVLNSSFLAQIWPRIRALSIHQMARPPGWLEGVPDFRQRYMLHQSDAATTLELDTNESPPPLV
uniref:hypothetical protein n=1 Tax=Streptomyces sp. SAT1 TaxID=1849967 RepID=UPI0019D21A3F